MKKSASLTFTLAILTAWVGSLGTQSARAALPPSEFLVKKATQRRAGIKVLKLQSSLQVALGSLSAISSNTTPPMLALKSTTWVDYESQRLLYSISDESGTLLVEGSQPFSRADQGTNLPRFGITALQNQSARLVADLKALAVPVYRESEILELGKTESERQAAEKTKMDRVEGKPAWLVGTDNRSGRAWFEKDSSALIKVSTVAEDHLFAFHLKWPKPVQDFPFARQWVLEISSANADAPQATVQLIREDFKEASALQDLQGQTLPKGSAPLRYTPAGEALDPDQKAGIERVIATYR